LQGNSLLQQTIPSAHLSEYEIIKRDNAYPPGFLRNLSQT